MDQNQSSPPLFGLTIDQYSRNHLGEAARWAKFLAIVGFIFCGLIVLSGLFFNSVFFSMGQYDRPDINDQAVNAMQTAMTIYFIIIAVLWFIPCLFLYYFATRMKTALLANNQDVLNNSFQNLKKTFRFVGIVTIILLSLYALGLIVTILGAAASTA